MNQPNQETIMKVSNPERIQRILHRMAQASLSVLLRIDGTTVAVKGRASSVAANVSTLGLRIANISDKGLTLLKVGQLIRVEFVMMSTKVVFQSPVLIIEPGSILVGIPGALVSIERRKNARHATTPDLMAYITVTQWQPRANDALAPPFFQHQEPLARYIAIGDFSQGGISGVVRFPSVIESLKRGTIDGGAFLHLPMSKPIAMPIEVRWTKRTRERVENSDGSITQMRSYRFGGEFVNPAQELQLAIRQFIQQISRQGAI